MRDRLLQVPDSPVAQSPRYAFDNAFLSCATSINGKDVSHSRILLGNGRDVMNQISNVNRRKDVAACSHNFQMSPLWTLKDLEGAGRKPAGKKHARSKEVQVLGFPGSLP